MGEENSVKISDATLHNAAAKGASLFLEALADAYRTALGGDPTAETMSLLNASQHTLLGYMTFRSEMLNGGFCQLIQNGYGPYIFDNPFAKSLRVLFGQKELSKLIYEAKAVYDKHREELERPRTEEEFMAMYEEFEAFDDLDDNYVEQEEEFTPAIARYVDEHISDFAQIIKE